MRPTILRGGFAAAVAAIAASPQPTPEPERDGVFDDYTGPNPQGQDETAKVAVERRGSSREEIRRWARAHGKTFRQVMADPALLAEVRP